MVDANLIRAARQADLAQFLLSVGVPLVRSGSRYRHKAHDSLVITGCMYYWNSKGESGNSLDYLVRHMGFDFKSAVSALAGFVPAACPPAAAAEPTGVAKNFGRVFAYLHKTRGIPYGILQALADKKLLAQEAATNNAVFFMRDEKGGTVGAELVGTLSDKRYKGVRAGSKYGYGFNYVPNGDRADFILFFESAVDLLSFIQIKALEGKDAKNCMLVSMCGLKANVVKHMTGAFGGVPVLCVDNDGAARRFVAAFRPGGPAVKLMRPDGRYKDWNEQLLASRRSFFPAPP